MEYYRGMLIQAPRIEAFRRCLSTIIQPGDHVLEVGAGLGTYAFFAAEAGAAKVWAIEGAAVVNVAKSLARVNEYADRVEFIRGWFPGVEIPERVDVLIFEDYPSRLMDAWTFEVVAQLHREALKPGARVVPDRARLFLAPVYSEQTWKVVGPYGSEGDIAYGIDWLPTREYICHTPLHMPIRAEDLRHEPHSIADVRLDTPPDATALAGSASWSFDRETLIHGFAYWFDLQVGEAWLSNAPNGEPGSWGYLYLPILDELVIEPGEPLTVRVAPEVTAGGVPSWLTWEMAHGETRFRGHEFKSFPASLSDVIPQTPGYVPELTDHARIEAKILGLADGKRSVDDIAQTIRGMNAAFSVDEARNLVLSTLAGRTKRT